MFSCCCCCCCRCRSMIIFFCFRSLLDMCVWFTHVTIFSETCAIFPVRPQNNKHKTPILIYMLFSHIKSVQRHQIVVRTLYFDTLRFFFLLLLLMLFVVLSVGCCSYSFYLPYYRELQFAQNEMQQQHMKTKQQQI